MNVTVIIVVTMRLNRLTAAWQQGLTPIVSMNPLSSPHRHPVIKMLCAHVETKVMLHPPVSCHHALCVQLCSTWCVCFRLGVILKAR